MNEGKVNGGKGQSCKAEVSPSPDRYFPAQICLKCTECNRGPDSDTPMVLGPKVSNKNFNISDICEKSFSKLLI